MGSKRPWRWEPLLSPRPGGGIWLDGPGRPHPAASTASPGMSAPSRPRPATPDRLRSSAVGCFRSPPAAPRHTPVSTALPRLQGQGTLLGQAIQEGEKRCSRRSASRRRYPHRRPRDPPHRGRDRPGHVPGGGVSSAGPGAVVLHCDRVVRPGRARGRSPCQRAAGWWSWVGSSSGAGPPRMAAPDTVVEVVAEELGAEPPVGDCHDDSGG